jgi:hypothetical protein
VKRKNSCYNFSQTQLSKWSDAQAACKALNSSSALITIDDLEEATFIQQYAKDLVNNEMTQKVIWLT